MITPPENTCCFTGHRPEALSFGNSRSCAEYYALYKKLFIAITDAIDMGYRHFVCGMARGIDLMAAEIVLCVKHADFRVRARIEPLKHYDLGALADEITLTAAVPFAGQAERWPDEDRELYKYLLDRSDEVRTLAPFYSAACMHARNRWMVDRSSRVIAVYNGTGSGGTYQTVTYAAERGLTIVTISSE